MGYFCTCEKCGKQVQHHEYRFEIDGDWLCLDCYYLLIDYYRKWITEKIKKVGEEQ